MQQGTRERFVWRSMMLLALLAAPLAASACKKKTEQPPQVASALPMQRVVLYRNGVGYFERSGKVDGEEIRFRVRESQVADFLASLTVVTRAGRPVQFVSFPVPQKKKEEETPTTSAPCWPGCGYPMPGACPGNAMPVTDKEGDGAADGEEPPEDAVEVVVRLAGGQGAHDVLISYVVESPIWRPTYRIVLDENGKQALLQGWAVVQNTSGEDWTDVALSVTEGAPLTFRADLANPFIPARPLVTDRGEVVQAAVSSSVSVSEETRRRLAAAQEQAPADTTVAYAEEKDEEASGGEGYGSGAADRGGIARGMGGRPSGAPATATATTTPTPPPPPEGLTAGGAQASLALLALGAEEGGITTYRSTAPVTIRDESSTLVAIFNQNVEASDTLLYRPDAGVPASSTHPFRVVRFVNQSGVTLERGPVAIFAKETFLGQGLLQPLPSGATTSIPYALERGVTVAVESVNDVEEARLVKVVHGVLTVQRYSVRKTKYVVQNLGGQAGRLFLQHSRWAGWELGTLPAGAEEVDKTTVIVPLEFPAQGKAELELVERSPMTQQVELMTEMGATAVRLYLAGPAVDAAAGPALSAALALRDRIGTIDTDIARFSAERNEVSAGMSETQGNLYAIEGIARAAELRTRLTTRLSDLEKRYAELQTKVIDLTAQRGELLVELSEALRDVTLVVPEPTAPPAGAEVSSPAPAATTPATP
jgi:hypothetical protein